MMSQYDSEEAMFKGFVNKSVQLFARHTPFYMARGNHEDRGRFATEYMNYFPTPTGKPYYYFRDGPVFFLVLDGGEDKPDTDIEYGGLAAYDAYRQEETEWLKSVVASEAFTQAPHRVVILHIPPYTSTWYGTMEINRLFMPILNNADIDVMFSGHLHRYLFFDKGAKGNTFPILANSANEIIDVQATRQKINVRIINAAGNVVKRFDF
jgi:hypothetical protein